MSLPYRIVRACLRTVAALALGAASAPAQPSQTPRNDLPQPYRTVRTWGQLPAGVKWAAVTAIEPAPDGTIYVVHRCVNNSCEGRSEPPILAFDKTGRLLRAFGAGLFNFPHGGTIDRDGNLWMTDARGGNGIGHQAIKLSPEGKVLMTLGTKGVSGSGPAHFDQPTDVVEAPNGDLFVTDSHRDGTNNRVVHFRKDGTYVREWGRKGAGPGEFSEPHTIAMDSQGRLFVGDRENNRIQIFDQSGRFLADWRQFGRPSGITITKDDTIYVADSESGGRDTGAHELPGIRKGIRIGSAKTGAVTAFIEDMEPLAVEHAGAEGVGVDADGHVYGGVVRRQMLERHEPIRTITPGALKVAVTTDAPTNPFDSQLWIRRYVERFAAQHGLRIEWRVVPFNRSWELAGQDAVDLVATNVASFPDRVSAGGTFSAAFLYERRALRITPEHKGHYETIGDFVGLKVGAVQGMAAERDLRRRAPAGVEIVTTATFPELYARFAAGDLDAVAEAEYYALDGTVIPSHGPEIVLIDHHDLTPGQREESVFVVRDKSTHLLAAVNAFIAATKFPLP